MCPHKVDEAAKPGETTIQNIVHNIQLIERCVESLSHSCRCNNAYCRRHSCAKMKRVVIHSKMCTRRRTGECIICKQLIALCYYHSKFCKEVRCMVLFCNNFKTKIRHQEGLLLAAVRRDRLFAYESNGHHVSGALLFDVNCLSGSDAPGPSAAVYVSGMASRSAEARAPDDEGGPNEPKRSRLSLAKSEEKNPSYSDESPQNESSK